MVKKSLHGLIIALMLTFSISKINAVELYNYQVTIYAGSYGLFNSVDAVIIDSSDTNSSPNITLSEDQRQLVVTNLKANDRIAIETSQITVTNEKYYAKGIKTGGRDNENEYIQRWYSVTKDNNYVVAYGIPGDQIEYTTYYVDQDGNQLKEPETYYGTIGEYTIAGYKYVDGYLPQAYNLGKTLTDNASENIYMFVYSPIPSLTSENGEVTVIPGTSASNDNEASDQNSQPINEDNEVTNQENQTLNQEVSEPEEIIDLDEEQTPLAGNESQEAANQTISYTTIGAGIVFLIVIIIALLYRKRKAGNYE